MRRLALSAFALALLHLLAMAGAAALPPREPADVVVVLGNTAWPDGTVSPRLEARLEAAHALYLDGGARRLLVSGAVGKEGANEAFVMRDWLLARGVRPEDVLVDGEGANTWLTARNTRALLDANGLLTAAVATSWFHVLRTRMALEGAGVDVVGAAPARFVEWRDLWSIPREVVALWAYLPRVTRGPGP